VSATVAGGPDPDLLARLEGLGVTLGPRAAPRGGAGRPDVMPLEEAVAGRVVEGPHGACYVSAARYTLDTLHGDDALGTALEVPLAAAAGLAGHGAVAGLDVSRSVFLDLETTGLGRDAGTTAFLIGAGRFQGDVFCVRQFFLRDPGDERAQLAALADWTSDCHGVITFNGRSFDVPLLTARQTMHRLPRLPAEWPHLDLLPPSRRLWRARLRSCALSSLERHVLAFERQDDVPGWLIPERYDLYRRTGDARPLAGVFRHNVFDVLSMVVLTARLARACAAPEAVLRHGRDWLGLARGYEQARDWSAAVQAYGSALARGLAADEANEALLRLAGSAKRGGDWSRAVTVWEGLAAAARPGRLAPLEELAKYWEHRASPARLDRALEAALRARGLVADGVVRPARGRRRALDDLDRRIARLRRRLGENP
jgi:uncharacterized protein